ncbi:MAG TPA: DNA polymerase III subunit alpha [Thermoanaerobaculia bacterium]|nr:DNA polymerase III subunit alpha [Thermoanaerobaculia bacterium]
MSQLVHLHLHSQFSLLDGANRLDDVIGAAVAQGMPALALTDHGNLFGAIELYNRARAAGIKPIVGIEAYVTPGDMRDRTASNRGGGANHLVLLARNEAGYRNLIKLSSRAFLEGFYYKPRMDKALLRAHSEGLIALSACLKGEIAEKITGGLEDEAEALALEYREIFGDGNFYLELQDHGIPEQRAANEVLRRISRRTGIPLVVTNDCHYLTRGDAVAHDVLLCIGTQKNVSDPDRLRYASDQFYLKTADEMYALFPEDAAAIENTLAIAERCDLTIPTGEFHLPEFPVPAGRTLDGYFAEVAREGLAERLVELRRLGSPTLASLGEEVYRERLEKEIAIIRQMGFPGYFLVVWDFIRHAREHRIPVGPGRGSAAGSLVSYALRITDIDPLRYGLLFERFLNPERISMPDIDIDFCMRRRGEVIDYVNNKYGRDKVAQIITFGTLAAKAVIRDVGRVMGMPFGRVDAVAKLVPDMTRSLDLGELPKLKEEVDRDPEVARVVEIGRRLEGLTRHASVHAAGVVITPQPIEELVPLYKTNKDEVTTQWDKDVVESLGLLKMDFLGLRTLTVLDDAVEMVRRQGIDLDLDAVPLDDAEVFRLFCEGRTNGIFQFESRGMKDLLRRAKPSKFEDLAAFNALYRPGALTSGMVEEYIRRAQGKRVTYVLPETKALLEETYGVIVYQEQVMQIAVEVAGFTLGEADVLRKAMGKKKLEVMLEQKEKFVSGAERRGVPRKKAEELWDYIEPFAGYGFNKSHSVAYAMLAYKTAYLKAHHPVAFMAAMLNSELGNTDSIAKYVRECEEMGIRVLPPDVNESVWFFTLEGDAIRFGLGGVKGVGEGAVEEVLAARRRVGRFSGLAHFAGELDGKLVHHKVFEMLIKAGCFDAFGKSRRALAEGLDEVLAYAERRRHEREVGQSTLFGGGAGEEAAADPDGPEWAESERLSAEKEALGFYLTGNPLSEHVAQLAQLASHTIGELKEDVPEGPVRLGGVVTKVRPTKIKSGRNAGRVMGRFVLEDLTGSLPAILFADHYDQFGHLLEEDAVVVLKGVVRDRQGEMELTVDEIQSLRKAARRLLRSVEVEVDGGLAIGNLQRLRDVLVEHAGETPLRVRVRLPGWRVEVAPRETFRVRFGPELVGSVEALLVEGAISGRYVA